MTNHWDKAYDLGRDYTPVSSAEIDMFLKYVDKDLPKKMLDIGCGTGQLTRELYHRGFTAIGIDLSKSAVKIAKSLTCVESSKLDYICADINESQGVLGVRTPFSLITCKLSYAFIKDKRAFIANIKKLLLPGGIFVVITPTIGSVPPEKVAIAASDEDISLLSDNFTCLESFQQKPGAYELTYFIGKKQ